MDYAPLVTSLVHANGKLVWIGAVVCSALFFACGAPRTEKAGWSASTQPADTSPAAEARAHADAGGHHIQPNAAAGAADPSPSAPDTVWVESAEADEIHVRSLTAIRLEATEIITPKRERSSSNPTPKDLGWGRLQGHRIQVNQLVAHSVRARRVVADEIHARTIAPLQGSLRWTPAPSSAAIVNQCVSAVDGGASEECFKERAF
jgi:hypothetical protein